MLIFTSDKSLICQWVNPRWVQIVLGAIAVGIIAVNIFLMQDTVSDQLDGSSTGMQAGIWVVAACAFFLYLAYMAVMTYQGSCFYMGMLRERGRHDFVQQSLEVEVRELLWHASCMARREQCREQVGRMSFDVFFR